MEFPKYKREYCCSECGLIWIEEVNFENDTICPNCNSKSIYPCDNTGFAYAYSSIVLKLKTKGKKIHYSKNHPCYKKEK